jgi:hypothetical protein
LISLPPFFLSVSVSILSSNFYLCSVKFTSSTVNVTHNRSTLVNGTPWVKAAGKVG